jgi:peptidoglycan L-alanyl-D-glutamate endopeptidase CwlK
MPYSLSFQSKLRLRDGHPDLVRVVNLAIAYSDVDFSVYEVLRTVERQREYVARGVSWTMKSKHLKQPDGYSHAVDLVPYVSGKMRWEWPVIYPVAAAVRRAAVELQVPIKWGGTWSLLNDLPEKPAEIEIAVEEYCAECIRNGRRATIDGPHYELMT